MRLVESFLTKNPCYTAGRKITVKGLMLPSVGCPQPRAQVFLDSWNRASFGSACVHGFIDGNDGTVYQALPWSHRGWHCGSGSKGSGNNTHIGVEITDLNIRKKPGTDQEKTGKYTGAGCFTIVAEADGVGASKWGLLKAYEKERDGWISLDYVARMK